MILIQLDYVCPFPTLPVSSLANFPYFHQESKVTIGDKTRRLPITRRQFSLTAAYAFTDHKAQGQTLELS